MSSNESESHPEPEKKLLHPGAKESSSTSSPSDGSCDSDEKLDIDVRNDSYANFEDIDVGDIEGALPEEKFRLTICWLWTQEADLIL